MHLAKQVNYPALVRHAGRARLVVAQLHIDDQTNLLRDESLVVSEGAYVGDPIWPCQLSRLLTSKSGSGLQSLTLSVGTKASDYANIHRAYEHADQSLSDSLLAQNFRRLYRTLGSVDLIDLAVANGCHQPSFLAFCQLLSEIGFELAYSFGHDPGDAPLTSASQEASAER